MQEGLLETAIEAARRAGEIQLRGLRDERKIEFKGEIDLVTEVDRACERTILEILKGRFPQHDVITEESPMPLSGSPYRWIVDPLDGTVNYTHCYPVFAVSIALELEGRLLLGVVYDPTRGELFWAMRGKGAYLNGEPLRVSDTDELTRALLVTGFPYDIRRSPVNNLDHFQNLILRAQAVRRDGCASLDLCYVAMGRFDGFWELKLRPWDVAAGTVIVEEAGGRVTDFDGRPVDIYRLEIAASNGLIHKEMLEVLRRGRRPTTESGNSPR